MSNRTVCDISKAQTSTLYWVDNFAHKRNLKPLHPTYLGHYVDLDAKIHGRKETLRERMEFLGTELDVWRPVCVLVYSANHRQRYEGKKALSIHKAFCARQFSKK